MIGRALGARPFFNAGTVAPGPMLAEVPQQPPEYLFQSDTHSTCFTREHSQSHHIFLTRLRSDAKKTPHFDDLLNLSGLPSSALGIHYCKEWRNQDRIPAVLHKLTAWFYLSDDGAVTVDWVVLTAAVIGLSVAVFAIYAGGAQTLADTLTEALSSKSASVGY